MKKISEFILSRLGVGLLAVAPIYLAGLLLLKVMKSLTAVVRPLAKLLPKWLPAEHIFSFLLVLIVCFLIGSWFALRQGERPGSEWRTLYSKESLATDFFEVSLSN